MSKINPAYLVILTLTVLWISVVSAANLGRQIEVSLQGEDRAHCGSSTQVCRTVAYALNQHLFGRATVLIHPGVYDEVNPLWVPPGVSIRGLTNDPRTVVLRPNFTSNQNQYFIELGSTSLNTPGNQTISFITFDGKAKSHHGWRGIRIANRDNVRIHHSRLLNWDRVNDGGSAHAIWVGSTEKLLFPDNQIRDFFPQDIGPSGDYSTWENWPKHPVWKFEFDHNFVYRSGGRTAGQARPGRAIYTRILKDSSFHDNEFDLRGGYTQAIVGIAAFFDNVDTYNNIFRAENSEWEKWYGDDSHSMYILETWGHINGSEWYGNVSSGSFSIALQKDGEIYDNLFLRNDFGPRIAGIGIELGDAAYTSIHHNYIFGGRWGLLINYPSTVHSRQYRDLRVYQNIFLDNYSWALAFDATPNNKKCRSGKKVIDGIYFYNNLVDKTRWGSMRIQQSCPAQITMSNVFVRNNIFLRSGDGYEPIIIYADPDTKNDQLAISVENNLFDRRANMELSVNCFCRTGNETVICRTGCQNVRVKRSLTSDPLFDSLPDIIVANNGDDATSARGIWKAGGVAELRSYRDDSAVHSGGSGDWYQFVATGLPTNHNTAVAIWWPRNIGDNRSTQVPIEIFDGSDSKPIATYLIDQATWNSSGWYYLGKHIFSSGFSRLRIKSVAGRAVVADAVLWSKLGRGYRLKSDSPARDAGSPRVKKIVTRDFFGNSTATSLHPSIGIHGQ